jgi:hypothetical protein
MKKQADMTASLNERERVEERQADDARQKQRDAERVARKAPDTRIYELTVKGADEPGLPPPLGTTNNVTADHLPATPPPPASGTSTNTTVAAEPSGNDPMLDETERILEDYIPLLSANKVLIAK